MKLYYITLNTAETAREVSKVLLNQRLAVCTNWFSINCSYIWEGEVSEGSEVALIVKSQAGCRAEIEEVVYQHVTYINFIGEVSLSSVNQDFLGWLNVEIPALCSPSNNLAAIKNSNIPYKRRE